MDEPKDNGAGGFGGDEEPTPHNPRRAASPEATAIRNLALALNSVAQHCGESASIVDELEGDERRHYLVALGAQLDELGELAFDARRIVLDIAG